MNTKASVGVRELWLALGLLALTGCGSGGSDLIQNSVTISVSPATIVAGQSATVSWSAGGGACTASKGWSGSFAASGSSQLTPATSGTLILSISCSGSGYSEALGDATLTVNAASAYTPTLLVADQTGGTALHTDANLTNPWGVVVGPTTPLWIANQRSQTSTLYDGGGVARALVVSFLNAGFAPTGIIFNGTATDFLVTSAGRTGGGTFIFDGMAGQIAGWSPAVDATHAVTMYADAGGAIYMGLTTAKISGAAYLYAADFHNRKVDVFNNAWVKQASSATAFTFSDPALPANYAPFGIQAVVNSAGVTQIVVSYAQQVAPANAVWANGAGLGYVDVFDTNGQLVKQLVVAGGKLNAPWGIALAPANFGTLSSALLIGNFGDGRVNGYDISSGRFLGTVSNATGTPIATPGLWGIAFGNDAANQPHGTLFYAAGNGGQVNGNFGRIDLGSTPPTIGATPTATITVPASPLRLTVTLAATAAATAPLTIAKVEFYAGSKLLGTATTAPYSIAWDTTTVANGSYALRAIATDQNGNVGSSAVVNATVTQ
jgi:uncharacterized protein (TIGR03118 family)